MRIDFELAQRWITPKSRVLDLGCGDGSLLSYLQEGLDVQGYGIELNEANINAGIAKGLSIVEQDLNQGLAHFADASFDTVVMARALQAVESPDALLIDMLRVGRQAIITFPNFAHWQNRVYLGIKGLMPVSDALPYEWYNTPNIHLCTFKDFEKLCHDNNIRILSRFAVTDSKIRHVPIAMQAIKRVPNLLADVAIYRVTLA